MNTKLIQLLQISDSAFPTGAYAFSDGLETLTQLGKIKNRESLKDFLIGQLELGWGRLDLIACALAWEGEIAETNELLDLFKMVESVRSSSRRIGSTLIKTAKTLWPEINLEQGHHVVVFGSLAKKLTIGKEDALVGFTSSWMIGKATASTRLFSVGGLDMQKMVAELEPAVCKAVLFACGATANDLGGFSPELDRAAHQQKDLPLRLFQS